MGGLKTIDVSLLSRLPVIILNGKQKKENSVYGNKISDIESQLKYFRLTSFLKKSRYTIEINNASILSEYRLLELRFLAVLSFLLNDKGGVKASLYLQCNACYRCFVSTLVCQMQLKQLHDLTLKNLI